MPKKPQDDKKKYNLRDRSKLKKPEPPAEPPEVVRWVDDDTLFPDDESADSEYEPPTARPTVITIEIRHGDEEEEEEEEYDDEDDDEDYDDEEYEEAIETLLSLAATPSKHKLAKDEQAYLNSLPEDKKALYLAKLENLSKITPNDAVPYKFRVLDMPVSEPTKAAIMRKVDMLQQMDTGESYKLRAWVDGLMRVPFGKTVPLPVSIRDGKEKCTHFLQNAATEMDKAIYGMLPAKLQIQQILAQWISNPASVGNVIALKGPMGVGKTSFARNGIANVLERPFMFFSLGGASDIANYVGHSFTYEGSTFGQIVDAIIRAGCMNPVFYFDELDKISTTSHGDEIVSMLIHLTDRSQNMHYHDRYFAGIDFDLSQCLFVFSFNDESKVHPILKDRMNVISCGGYSEADKKIILAKYVWESVLERVNVKPELITLQEDAVSYLISEYSHGEEGVRNLIRATEAIVTRANLLYISQRTDYPFYVPITFPMTITRKIVEKLLTGLVAKEVASWTNMYT